MDAKFQSLIDDQMSCWPGAHGSLDAFMEICHNDALFWLEDGIEPWERDMGADELMFRSLFEFSRTDLTASQLVILEKWDANWREFHDKGVFHERVREEGGGRFSWDHEREHAEERLGRLLPKSHWWYWPQAK